MKIYDVQEVFEILKENKITTNVESVRRWLRNGTIEGMPPLTRKFGWKVTEKSLDKFLAERLPQQFTTLNNANEDEQETVIKLEDSEVRTKAREEMWWELINKNIFENYIVIEKDELNEFGERVNCPIDLVEDIWERACNETASKTPRIFYLLEAFRFEGKRIILDTKLKDIREQIIYGIIEHVIKEKRSHK